MNSAERSARANIGASALRDMVAAVDDKTMRDILRDNRAPQGPCSAVPSSAAPPPSPSRPANVEPQPLSLPPGVPLIDAQLQFLDAKEKAERVAEQNAAAAQTATFQKFMRQAAKWDAVFAEFQKAMLR
jgi:hypothetical protein